MSSFKKKFLDNVFLYDYEYSSLLNDYGEEKTKKCIEELSLYKKSKGVDYENDYAAIKRWVILRLQELELKNDKNIKYLNSKNNNCEQRHYSKEFFKSLYKNIP